MARIRTVKPEFWSDSKTGMLSDFTTKLFLGMLNFCDDMGVIEYNPSQLRAQIFPYRPVKTADKIKTAISKDLRCLVELFAYKGKSYIKINGFEKHQKVDHPAKPNIPSDELAKAREDSRKLANVSEDSRGIPKTREAVYPPRESSRLKEGREGKEVREGSKQNKNIDAAPSGSGSTYKVDTPLQKAVVGWKIINGFTKDDRDWDKLNWGRTAHSVKPMLDVFKGDFVTLVDCMQDIYEELKNAKPRPLECTIETVRKRAMDWRRDHDPAKTVMSGSTP